MTPPRTPEALKAAVAALQVGSNPVYQPGHLVTGSTWCNRFASDVTALLGCPVPFHKANEQLAYLAGLEGAGHGWRELVGPTRRIVAVDQAERGFPTLAVWSNPGGHGHIALLIPGPPGKMFIAQAGATNFSSGPISAGFGTLPFRLFTHG